MSFKIITITLLILAIIFQNRKGKDNLRKANLLLWLVLFIEGVINIVEKN